MQSSRSEQKLNVRPRALVWLKPYVQASVKTGSGTTLARTSLALFSFLIVTCGGRTSDSFEGPAGTGGGSAIATGQGDRINSGDGGQANSSTANTSVGGKISATGGATSLEDRCNGLHLGCPGEQPYEVQIDGGTGASVANAGSPCDLPLQYSPPSPYRVIVVIDCNLQSLVPDGTPDATANGFVVDYSQDPAHLQLLGTSCDTVKLPGTHFVDVGLFHGCIY